MKTRIACVLIVVVGAFLHVAHGHFSHPKVPYAEAATYFFVGYMLSVPILLFFLRGERPWRLAVFGIWSIYVGLWIHIFLTMD